MLCLCQKSSFQIVLFKMFIPFARAELLSCRANGEGNLHVYRYAKIASDEGKVEAKYVASGVRLISMPALEKGMIVRDVLRNGFDELL